MKSCPSCKANVIDTAKFCNRCGANLENNSEASLSFCISCGEKLPYGSAFCIKCGSRQPNESAFEQIDFDALDSLSTDKIYENEGLKVENGVLVSYTGKRRYVIVPGTIDEIYDNAFAKNDTVTVIEIGEGVRVIGKGAFFYCKSLEKLIIPSSVERIYDDSFLGIFFGTKLSTLVLPKIDMHLIKRALSEVGRSYFDEKEIYSFITKNGNQITVDIKAIEQRSESKRRAEEERKAEEARIKREYEAEQRRIAEEKAKREAEERRLKEQEEQRKRAEEEKAKRRAEEEARRKAEEEARKRAELAKWVVGGNPYFGRYEWTVLSRNGNKALLISKYAIECKSYNLSFGDVTWESCSLRRWLNGEFITESFNSKEIEKIQSTYVITPNMSNSRGGNATTDRVFLLSYDEVKRYFDSDDKRKCEPTEYAKSRGVYVFKGSFGFGKSCFWWLRSPGNSQNFVACVDHDGQPYGYGRPANDTMCGVRPAMWISVE